MLGFRTELNRYAGYFCSDVVFASILIDQLSTQQVENIQPIRMPSSSTPFNLLLSSDPPPRTLAAAPLPVLSHDEIVHPCPASHPSKVTELGNGLLATAFRTVGSLELMEERRGSESNLAGDEEKGELPELNSGERAGGVATTEDYPDGGWRAWR